MSASNAAIHWQKMLATTACRATPMKIWKSSAVPHRMDAVRFAYAFAKSKAQSFGHTLTGTHVKVMATNCGGRNYHGRAWRGRNSVLLRFGKRLPAHLHEYGRFKNMPTCWIWGGEESIAYLAAHEFGHLIGWGSGKLAEIACCKFGYEAVQAWRDRQYEHPACLI